MIGKTGRSRKRISVIVIICVLLTALALCSCSSGDKENGQPEAKVPVIVLPDMPATVKVKDGLVSVQSFTLDNNYDETAKKLTASYSIKIENTEGETENTCKVSYKILNENDLIIATGIIESKEAMIGGAVFEGKIDISNVQAGKKYSVKFF